MSKDIQDELRAEIAKALHINWAFKDTNGKPTRIVIDGTPKGAYHTSYDLFVDGIVKLINSEALKLLDRLERQANLLPRMVYYDGDMRVEVTATPLSAIQKERKEYKSKEEIK